MGGLQALMGIPEPAPVVLAPVAGWSAAAELLERLRAAHDVGDSGRGRELAAEILAHDWLGRVFEAAIWDRMAELAAARAS